MTGRASITGPWVSAPSTAGTPSTPIGRAVAAVAYKPGWSFAVLDDANVTVVGTAMPEPLTRLEISVHTPDSDNPSNTILVTHHFFVPPLSSLAAARRWLRARIRDVEGHEEREFLRFDGVRFDPPNHGLGQDPYR